MYAPVPIQQIDKAKLAYRYPLFHKDFPAILFWSHKAGCTVILKWFFHRLNLLETALAYSSWPHDYETQVFTTRENYLSDVAQGIAQGRPLLKFVRDPAARAFSGYLEICKHKVTQDPRHWAHRLRPAILASITGGAMDSAWGFSFRQYLRWLSEQDPQIVDPHLAPQRTAIEEDLPVRILPIETMPAAMNALEVELGLSPTDPALLDGTLFTSKHHHSRGMDRQVDPVAVLDLAVPLLRPKPFFIPEVTLGDVLESDLKDLFLSVYAADVRAYGALYGVDPAVAGRGSDGAGGRGWRRALSLVTRRG